ncbi:uncharacterized protein NP_0242A [Natronomonas pharaonis DSM 2160]|uniref:Uncharacterized protein n=1 Tax=Natronomonas pharaonis (strain ATCC 35678 / DSM 2160 / CIP 103997 / JCM 8858 / NBRC 14720 / NCIMB 2260 / Gabara) TaxID=348780 RepID=A0A1U7ETH7_NATPD|nr:DUF6735 family protein [Natronomonas pharaonis]CAI48212.1 uncharacterized protein NP_0242A [Natronomonas pharaonis DSM 2160]
MGHRTLVAYDRDGYDLHYAHWTPDPESLTVDTPFGRPPEDDWARKRADRLLDAEGGRLTEHRTTAVDSDPLATDLSFTDIGGYIDPLEHERLYVVDPSFSVTTYVVFGVENGRLSPPDAPTVALVGYDGERDAAYLRGWLAGGRAVRGVAGPDGASIVAALRWLDPDRGTVVWLPGSG